MTASLCDFIATQRSNNYATRNGTNMHERLRQITISKAKIHGDQAIIKHIIQNTILVEYFAPDAKTEVPIAGTINGKFISRRIDRMIINPDTKHIKILDYKTDTDCTARRAKYQYQLREYRELLHKIYPDFTITSAILWTHNWTLEEI